MADEKPSKPAPAAAAPSFDEWRSRLDAGARQAGIGAATQPAAGFPLGGPPGTEAQQAPGWAPYPYPGYPPYPQPMAYPGPTAYPPPYGPPAPGVEEPSSLGTLVQSAVELLTVGVGAARQIVQAVAGAIPSQSGWQHEPVWGGAAGPMGGGGHCAPMPSHGHCGSMPSHGHCGAMPGHGCCGAAHCGAHHGGSCMHSSFHGGPSSVRTG